MTKTAPRKRRPRGSIDPEKILDGAFEIAGRDGLEGLSMPILAGHLDVGVTSIYWYFRNKDDLLRQMNARATRDFHERTPSTAEYAPEDWRQFLRDHALMARANYSADDLLIDLSLMKTSTYSGTNTRFIYQGLESNLAYLVSAGFRPSTAWYVFSTMSLYTRGFVITERNRRQNHTPPEDRTQLDLLSESMPLLGELVANESIIIDNTGDASFEFGLEMILDSAERRLERDREAG